MIHFQNPPENCIAQIISSMLSSVGGVIIIVIVLGVNDPKLAGYFLPNDISGVTAHFALSKAFISPSMRECRSSFSTPHFEGKVACAIYIINAGLSLHKPLSPTAKYLAKQTSLRLNRPVFQLLLVPHPLRGS